MLRMFPIGNLLRDTVDQVAYVPDREHGAWHGAQLAAHAPLRAVATPLASDIPPRVATCSRLASWVPAWYRPSVAMNLRLTDSESAALRRKAAEEGRSMQEVARSAIAQYVSDRPDRLRAAIERVRTEDAELLDRLSR